MVLPCTSAPARWLDCEPGNFPARTIFSPSIMRRATASISPKWMSAVASATIGGTTVTGMPRLVASATSILSGVIDIEATARNFGLAASTARSMRSCSSENRMSHFFTAAISFGLAMILLELVLILTAAIARRRSSALGAIGCVTKTRVLPLTAATARHRPRHRRRIARHRGFCGWRRARRAPSECRARARAKPDATWSRQARRRRRRPVAGCG